MLEISERIVRLMEVYNLTPSLFADEIGVQRSAISHILSGRNKPSLEFIQKVLIRYKDLNPQWILTGVGNMKQLDLFEQQTSDTSTSKQFTNEVKDTKNSSTMLNNGSGEKKEVASIKPQEPLPISEHHDILKKSDEHISDIKESSFASDETMPLKNPSSKIKAIEKIIVFYTDHTFSVHMPE
jgi:transcriptional regulator with XRE-family HTH domain